MAVVFKTKPVLLNDKDGVYHIQSPNWLSKVVLIKTARIPEKGIKVKIDFKDEHKADLFPEVHKVSKEEYDTAPIVRVGGLDYKAIDCSDWIR